ncbi:unnamed protein product [Didymodactylos carnosus]|uniref:Uncharacterized protein n=1 Tax=Didymodactylos carnosus TaxID=1234261 RepID=A0A814H4I9_9BILA|nr:unnamed protein product [Didymodactylos carnosus]CAF1004344.1 unnamed protein product [Didymodactylos carnosus]CAF3600786.1 unnamed protein product [Didymodactylos carnosus]CAF3775695.1 unnamed protein product [Didymodactylos carnosus]
MKPASISWKTYTLSTRKTVQYAEITMLSLSTAEKLKLASAFYRFHLSIQVNIPSIQLSHTVVLETSKFVIGTNTSQITNKTAKVMLNDIEEFSGTISPSTVEEYVCRYFKQKIRVEPLKCVRSYVQQQLNKACENADPKKVTLNFLTRFITQAEFMVTYPLLALLHADGLLLGICDSSLTKDLIVTNTVSSIGLRFNSITQENQTQTKNAVSVRVDVHNKQDKFERQTLNSNELMEDFCNLICAAHAQKFEASILSDIVNGSKGVYKLNSDFSNYFDEKLPRLFQENLTPYTPVFPKGLHFSQNKSAPFASSTPNESVTTSSYDTSTFQQMPRSTFANTNLPPIHSYNISSNQTQMQPIDPPCTRPAAVMSGISTSITPSILLPQQNAQNIRGFTIPTSQSNPNIETSYGAIAESPWSMLDSSSQLINESRSVHLNDLSPPRLPLNHFNTFSTTFSQSSSSKAFEIHLNQPTAPSQLTPSQILNMPLHYYKAFNPPSNVTLHQQLIASHAQTSSNAGIPQCANSIECSYDIGPPTELHLLSPGEAEKPFRYITIWNNDSPTDVDQWNNDILDINMDDC